MFSREYLLQLYHFWNDTMENRIVSELSRLPGPVSDLWEWQYKGVCRGKDSSLFFHPDGERGGTRRRRANQAKAICATCPVIEQCREHALASQEPYGVWGGLSEDERRSLLRKRLRSMSFN